MLASTLCTLVMPLSLSLMSYNVRYANPADGANAWVYRQGLVYDVIARRRPDVLGVQEALAGQMDDLLVNLPGYAYVGVGRDDGKRGGEFSAILYRPERLSVEDSGTFWLSDTPDVPGSKSWGNQVVRICTWARFSDRVGGSFTVFNAHLDHESQFSREKSAELLVERVGKAGGRTVVMGDFNAGERNAALVLLRAARLSDTFRGLYPDEVEVGTFNGFDRAATKGEKIDYVLVSSGWTILDAGIDRTAFDGRVPSDHFPVWAVVSG